MQTLYDYLGISLHESFLFVLLPKSGLFIYYSPFPGEHKNPRQIVPWMGFEPMTLMLLVGAVHLATVLLVEQELPIFYHFTFLSF